MNIVTLLEMASEGMGDRPAIGTRDNAMTYLDLLDRARRVASSATDRGVDRVGLVGVNSEAVPVLLFAAAIAGLPFVPMNYRLADDRLRSVCERTAPSMLVVDEPCVERLQGLEGVELLTWPELERDAASAAPTGEGYTDPDDVAIWLFTSGTTGEPKAATLRHRHLVSYVLSTVDFMSAGDDEATLVSVPPYHIAGMATILSNTYAGRRIVYLSQFDAEEWVRVAEAEAVTHTMVVPTMLPRILDSADKLGATLPALRHLSYGGGRMPVSIIERAMATLPQVGFVNAYGLTETSSTVAVLGPEDHRVAFASDDPRVRARLGSVGRPLPSLELEVRDPSGDVVPTGETGEVYIRGEQVAGEYHGGSVLNEDGWFATHDAGHLDSDGFLYVEGRLDDVIVRGGENMSPGEIEDVLLQHPAVAEAGVTGVPDDEWGEAVAAAVVLDPGATATEAELCEWVRASLRSSRVPVLVDVRDALPYNETGKLLRRVLKVELAAALASSSDAQSA